MNCLKRGRAFALLLTSGFEAWWCYQVGEGRTPEQVEVLAVAWGEQGMPKMVARGGGKSSRWLPPQSLEPGGNVEMNCCCFSGSKFGGEPGGGRICYWNKDEVSGSERMCWGQFGYGLEATQASSAGQCCPPVAVLSTTKPGYLPWTNTQACRGQWGVKWEAGAG